MEVLELPLGVFTQNDLDWFGYAGIIQSVEVQTPLVRAGDYARSLYWVLDGEFVETVSSLENDDQEVSRVQYGEPIGLLSLITARPMVTQVSAIAPSRVLALTHPQLTGKLRQDPGFSARFYQTTAVMLSNQLRKISSLLVRSQVKPEPPLRKVLLVFAELYDSDLDWMVQIGTPTMLSTNGVLIEAGKNLDAIYILLEGMLSVFVSAQINGAEVSKEIARLATGEILGEMSFVDAQGASATVKAVEKCLVWALPRSQLLAKLTQDQRFAARFYRAFSVVLADRVQDRLTRHGYGKQTYSKDQPLDNDLEYEDELDLSTLENISLAGVRFDWLLKRVQSRF